MLSTTGLAPLALVTCLAFGPFSGCGVEHRGYRDGIPSGTPTAPPEPGPKSIPPAEGPTVIDAAPVEVPSSGTPEPATLLLAGAAAASYGLMRLRRKKEQSPEQA